MTRIFLFNILLSLQIFGLNLAQVKNTSASALSNQFSRTRAEYILLFDSFLRAYGEHEQPGQFPEYSFTEEQFTRYQAQFARDILSSEKSLAYEKFEQQRGATEIITINASSPSLWKNFIRYLLDEFQLIKQYSDFIVYHSQLIDRNTPEIENNIIFIIMRGALEIAQNIERSTSSSNFDNCENFILFMTLGTNYSFNSLKIDLNNDIFFRYLRHITQRIKQFKMPQLIDPYMPVFNIERAKTQNQEQQLKEIISTFKSIDGSRGILSVADFNNLQMARFCEALKVAEYSYCPDDIIVLKNQFNISLSQFRFLRGYEQIGCLKNSEVVLEELSSIFSSNEKNFINFLRFSESEKSMTCSQEQCALLREAVFEKAFNKDYNLKLDHLTRTSSGENLEFDKKIIAKIREKITQKKCQEESGLKEYYESIRPKKKSATKSKKTKKKNSSKNNERKVTEIKSKNKSIETNKGQKSEPVILVKKSKPGLAKKSKNKKRPTQTYKPTSPFSELDNVGYRLTPYEGPTDAELREAAARPNLERQIPKSKDGITMSALRKAQKFGKMLKTQFSYTGEHESGGELSYYRELRRKWEQDARYKQRYRLLLDFYENMQIFEEYEQLIIKLGHLSNIILQYSFENDKIPAELFTKAHEEGIIAFKDWRNLIERLELNYPPKLDDYYAAIVNPIYKKISVEEDDEEYDEEDQEEDDSSSITVILEELIPPNLHVVHHRANRHYKR